MDYEFRDLGIVNFKTIEALQIFSRPSTIFRTYGVNRDAKRMMKGRKGVRRKSGRAETGGRRTEIRSRKSEDGDRKAGNG